ncbi:thioredoxin family protein [Sulfurimonas sp.]|nr:thioredoxin family protein [Sulfurimonas sp.]
MKTLLVLLLLNFTLFGAHIDRFAQEMKFERDYNTALEKAKKENKVLMMVLSADYCPWCRKFENKTLKSKLLQAQLDQDVISLVVDKKFDMKTFPEKFKTQFTPKVFFINPKDENILHETIGYVKKKEFSNALHDATSLFKDTK